MGPRPLKHENFNCKYLLYTTLFHTLNQSFIIDNHQNMSEIVGLIPITEAQISELNRGGLIHEIRADSASTLHCSFFGNHIVT